MRAGAIKKKKQIRTRKGEGSRILYPFNLTLDACNGYVHSTIRIM